MNNDFMIEDYSFGRIVIDGKTYHQDVIIYPDKVDANWWRKEGHNLHVEDIGEALESRPEVIVVGTGAHGSLKVPMETRRQIESRGIEVVVVKTQKAASIYNKVAGKKKTVAALHLTC